MNYSGKTEKRQKSLNKICYSEFEHVPFSKDSLMIFSLYGLAQEGNLILLWHD